MCTFLSDFCPPMAQFIHVIGGHRSSVKRHVCANDQADLYSVRDVKRASEQSFRP
jgi:hypothetical protein